MPSEPDPRLPDIDFSSLVGGEASARRDRFDAAIESFGDLARMMAGYRDALMEHGFQREEAQELVLAYQQTLMLGFPSDEDDDDDE